MAAGEYVSVHSQADTERADLDIERVELKTNNKDEHKELAAIYLARVLDPPCICLFIGIARTSGWIGSTRGRGRSGDRRNARDVLGWIGHDHDRWHRM